MRVIETDADIAEGLAHLCAVEPRFAHARGMVEDVPLRRRDDGFLALRDTIVGQQVSVAAGAAIRARLDAAGVTGPEALAGLDDEALRACGLSRQKVAYLRAIAAADLDYAALRRAPEEEVVARLTAIKGLGRWSAEIYLLFALGRADTFAPADLALQEAARLLFALPERPAERMLREMSAPWAPWRAVAARLLWSYYHVAKGREGVG